ncbi:hypothetical protein EDD18DRAFT_421501 [Armillaria luteobubalina]|uniref:Extracellular membrane protein CFEM domain-containing protein n=1 Tax=Armillaria luteobubalina TaxID=153913 RepID=A0AA39Q0P4_9AGAR|nr:hypothetical protein EDD18DRAFT_421501 [Armillaria luteobubalina]
MLAFSFLFALILALPGALSHQFYDLASPHIYLAARQSTKNLTELPQSSIPSVCSANCTQSVITYLSNCSTTECMCDNQTDQSIASCVNCVVTQGNITSDIGKAVINTVLPVLSLVSPLLPTVLPESRWAWLVLFWLPWRPWFSRGRDPG